ncbi:HTH_48 domain-containing protein [Trichonephila clavipes]|nr:HTH_48 domain-containing protein [Trichonephila clavipes]
MRTAIENPASCEMRSVIWFVLVKSQKPMEINRQVSEVYGNNVINESSILKWCIQFKNGRTNAHGEEKSGRPTIVTDELVA